MDVDKATIGELFERERRYLVPIFQRGYVWTRERQWESLWADICDQTTELAGSPNISIKNVRKHFLGAIVLAKADTRTRQIDAFEIIDGQQRLLTLQVLLLAVRDVAKHSACDRAISRLERFTRNPDPVSDPDECFKVWPTGAFHRELRQVATAGGPKALEAFYPQRLYYRKLVPPRPLLVQAYLFFHEKILVYIDDAGEELDGTPLEPLSREDRIEMLVDAITKCVELAVVDLGEHDDPQVIFETLNARGVPLEPSDLVRNYIFLDASRQGLDVAALYQTYWSKFDEDDSSSQKYWKQEERQGRFKRSRLDLFLFHYLTYRLAREVNMGHVYQQFRSWWSAADGVGHKRDILGELTRLNRAADHFKMLSSPKEHSSRLEDAARVFKVVDVTTIYPLVLWLCEKSESLGPIQFDGILSDLESYLIRRLVCGLTPKNYNRLFLSLLAKLQSMESLTRATLQAEMQGYTEDTNRWPSDREFEQALLGRPLYSVLRAQQVNMLLRGIELSLHTNRQEELSISTYLTIEHVLPQYGKLADWPYPQDGPSQGLTEPERAANRYVRIHTLGNLTLLTQSLNSEVSNGPFRRKRPEIAKQSQLRLNAYFQDYTNEDSWDEGDIFIRGEKLAELALKVWPRPT